MKVEINHRKRNEKKNDYMETKQHATKIQWVSEEIKEIKKYLKTINNEDTSTQNLWNATKAVLREKFIAI